MRIFRLTGVCWHQGEAAVSKCPELVVASCGDSIEEVMVNLREAVELFLENAQAGLMRAEFLELLGTAGGTPQ